MEKVNFYFKVFVFFIFAIIGTIFLLLLDKAVRYDKLTEDIRFVKCYIYLFEQNVLDDMKIGPDEEVEGSYKMTYSMVYGVDEEFKYTHTIRADKYGEVAGIFTETHCPNAE